MKILLKPISILLFFIVNISGVAFSATTPGAHDFTFYLTIPKNSCEINISGTSKNIVDFGNLPLDKFKSQASEGKIVLPFDVKLTDCKTTPFSTDYISISGNYTVNDGFLDDSNKTFAVRISEQDNAIQSDNVFYTNTNNRIWKNINENDMTKRFYAYVMCKNGVTNCAIDSNVGKFKATLTLTYVSD